MSTNIESLREVPEPLEAIHRLYRNGRRVRSYSQILELDGGIRENHLQAAGDFLFFLENSKKPFIGILLGCMASGKSTTLGLVAKRRPDCQVFKHALDLQRAGENLTNHSGGISIPAKSYQKIEDIKDQLRPVSGSLVVVDELQFAANTRTDIFGFIEYLRKQRINALLAGLDFDFARQPWETTQAALEQADIVYVLAAECMYPGCSLPASFTQRLIDGSPAPVNAPKIAVGGLDDLYEPRCIYHHQI